MGSGSRSPKMRRLDSRRKKLNRIKRHITVAKAAAVVRRKSARSE